MTTALANVSDDWVQRAFAEELGGVVKRVGGGRMTEEVVAQMRSSIPAVIMVFLLWNYLAIISIVATPKRRGSTKGLGAWALIASIIEIAFGIGSFIIVRSNLSRMAFSIYMVMTVTILFGFFVAILLLLSKLNPFLDVLFNGIRIACFTVIYLLTIFSFSEFKGKDWGIAFFCLVMAGLLMAAAIMKPKQKTSIGLVSFFSVLLMGIMSLPVYFLVIVP